MEKIVDSNSKAVKKSLDEVYGMLSDLSPRKPVSVEEMHRGIAKKVKERLREKKRGLSKSLE